MPNLKYTKTFEHPPLTPIKAIGIIVLGILVLEFFWALSALLYSPNAPFPLTFGGKDATSIIQYSANTQSPYYTPSIHSIYVAVVIWFGIGCVMFFGVLLINYIMAPWNKWRKLYVPDEAYTNSTYECGENPVGEGHTQTNLQYYSFAIVFVVFDVITSYILLFSLIVNAQGLDLALQILGIAVFSVIPLLILGFWLHKKAILWQ